MKHFKEKEFFCWIDHYTHKTPCYREMSHRFLSFIDDVREDIDTPIKITSSWSINGHATHSYHYKGRAIDFRTPHKNYIETAREIKKYADKYNLTIGLGLYPYPEPKSFALYKGRKFEPYLHLDNGTRKGKSTYWYRNKKGEYYYHYDLEKIINNARLV